MGQTELEAQLGTQLTLTQKLAQQRLAQIDHLEKVVLALEEKIRVLQSSKKVGDSIITQDANLKAAEATVALDGDTYVIGKEDADDGG